jgi:hypothetical protein
MVGDIVAALFIFFVVLPLAGAAVLWLLGKALWLFWPSAR